MKCMCVVFCVIFVFKCVFLELCQCQDDGNPSACDVDGTFACVPVSDCATYVELLKNSETTEEGLKITQERQCGFQGESAKVCCPTKEPGPTVLLKRVNDDGDDFVDAFPLPGQCGHKPEKTKPTSSLSDLPRLKRQLTDENGQYKPNSKEMLVNPEAYVFGGTPANRQMSTWMALLGYRGSTVFWQCGGTIITARHVLTAAHCIKRSLYIVRVGELDLASEEKDASPIDFLVKKAIRHENYTKFHNDIAVVVINGTIDFEAHKHLEPICLPLPNPEYTIFDNKLSYVMGWGETEHESRRSNQLLYAYVDILDRSHCARAYSNSSVTIDERVICAGDAENARDACSGDSGGPLISEYFIPYSPTPNNAGAGSFHFQLGVVSYGFKCSARRFAGVYTNVSHFMPWLREKVLRKTLD